jgi:acyl CoA:acetate/3-ketoacid CoA transferase beta subunit
MAGPTAGAPRRTPSPPGKEQAGAHGCDPDDYDSPADAAALLDIPAVGGAMDLATGARQIFVMMSLLSRDGTAKLVRKCTYALTGPACVSRVYTDLAVFLIDTHGVVVRDVFGITFDRLTALVDPPLIEGTIS